MSSEQKLHGTRQRKCGKCHATFGTREEKQLHSCVQASTSTDIRSAPSSPRPLTREVSLRNPNMKYLYLIRKKCKGKSGNNDDGDPTCFVKNGGIGTSQDSPSSLVELYFPVGAPTQPILLPPRRGRRAGARPPGGVFGPRQQGQLIYYPKALQRVLRLKYA
eukprot:g47714.t1